MAIIFNPAPEARIPADQLAAWAAIPSAVVSDDLDRSGAMGAAMAPLASGMNFAGQALTVRTMAGDNGPLHHAVTLAWPGCVLVIDARSHLDTAVWGGVLTAAAMARGVSAVVVDGAVRDAAELRQSGMAVFALGISPCGPQKGEHGAINVPIACAGMPVAPGDLVVGDDDGITVVRPDQMGGLLEKCRARLAKEDDMVKQIAAGTTTVELLGLAPLDGGG